MSDVSVKLTVLYPNTPGSSVDWEYYLGPHLELARRLLTPFGLQRIEIERGIAGIIPGAPPPFHAIASLYFPSAGALQEALAQTAGTLSTDQRKYYVGESLLQISEAVQA
jgi:uncharacterized protein (TIGR02118 family)